MKLHENEYWPSLKNIGFTLTYSFSCFIIGSVSKQRLHARPLAFIISFRSSRQHSEADSISLPYKWGNWPERESYFPKIKGLIQDKAWNQTPNRTAKELFSYPNLPPLELRAQRPELEWIFLVPGTLSE